ncbi:MULTISPECIES: LLM class F420-dependent oxidoreductase [Parafrankia]|uniref:LLM class F420-dependent oxidoreductase n=1 Tax=Parafrankia soli TaxID=2599596 RepID=A0A1S1PGT9_9ACTN|nr:MULTISPECIES: LLM class F420-dependent oxidoreductase [Parafrankia]OHV19244.1 LLM class F420-dependent oxidoreductase [Parafrankia soli]TCJ31867.1 LLM class F420-dependent oxidoreductase [Parafrankia sp. BMG5.11]SQD94189.1 Luciferase family protein [Parafrankia sp. Ea1.12]
MRIGLMIGSDRDRQYRERVRGFIADAQSAEEAGFASMWMPQIPGYFDALTVVTLMGQATRRIELGTAVVPVQTRHPVVMAQQVLSTQAVCEGRFTLGIGPSHHWIIEDQLGLSYERPAHLVRNYLQVLNAAFAGPGRIDVDNDTYRVHSPLDVTDLVPTPTLIAALAPVMLRISGEQTSGTILWMADERAIGDYVVPRITKAATDAGRPAPRIVAGVPVALCPAGEVDAARSAANEVLGHADYSPNYKRLLDHGDARDVGDVMAVGDESAIVERLRGFRDAGVTDLAARVVALGADRAERVESQRRTQAFLATLCSQM